MDGDEDGAYGPMDEDGSGTGYESASDTMNNRRKKESSDEEQTNDAKKRKKEQKNKKDKDQQKDKEQQKDKDPQKENDRTKNKKDKNKYSEREDGESFLNDGWIKNKTIKTFFLEPTDEKHKLHIMEIAKLLHNIKITTYTELKPAGKFRYKITFNNPRHAEDLINSKILTETYKYKIYAPKMYQETIGVLRDVPLTLTDQDIYDNLESNRITITKVERIQRMENKKLTPTFSVKIYAEGEKLPQEVKVYGIVKKVSVYLFPLKFCWKCLRYGHKTNVCKSQQIRCYNCSLNDHEGAKCTSLNILCFHCKEPHQAYDSKCKERTRQDNIRKAMAYNKLTFMEAEKLYPRPSQTEQRLQSLTEYPAIPENQSNEDKIIEVPIINNNPRITENVNNNKTTENGNFITKAELEQIVNKLKIEIVKQLNLNKLINKIKEIQDKIKESVANKSKSHPIDQNLFLISISEQLDDLINPQIIQQPKPPNKPNNNGSSPKSNHITK